LALALAAREISRHAVVLKLTDVPPHGLPPLDLPCIFVRQAPPPVVPAVPLKPTARVSWMQPPVAPPHRERLAGFDPEKVQRWIKSVGREFGAHEPAARKLVLAVGHVLAPEYAKPKHFGGRQLRAELGIEVASGRRCQLVAIASLHPVIDFQRSVRHASCFTFPIPHNGDVPLDRLYSPVLQSAGR
jgi:hypothetical protein